MLTLIISWLLLTHSPFPRSPAKKTSRTSSSALAIDAILAPEMDAEVAPSSPLDKPEHRDEVVNSMAEREPSLPLFVGDNEGSPAPAPAASVRAAPVHASIDKVMIQVRRIGGGSTLCRPGDLRHASATRDGAGVISFDKLAALAALELRFDAERENLMYQCMGNETVTVSSDLSLAAALEEMALEGARRFAFVMKARK